MRSDPPAAERGAELGVGPMVIATAVMPFAMSSLGLVPLARTRLPLGRACVVGIKLAQGPTVV